MDFDTAPPRYVDRALFAYSEAGVQFKESIEINEFGVRVTSFEIASITAEPQKHLSDAQHVVVCGEYQDVKSIIQLSQEYDFSIGIIPLIKQKRFFSCYRLPKKTSEAIELALRSECSRIDLALINDQPMLFNASIGAIPLVAREEESWLSIFYKGLKQLSSLHLEPFTISVNGSKKAEISTAATGCLLFETQEKDFFSAMIGHNSSFQDKLISLAVISPFSVVHFINLLLNRLNWRYSAKRGSSSIGFIKSPKFIIDSEHTQNVVIDGEAATTTPARCQVIPAAIAINVGQEQALNDTSVSNEETISIGSLPTGRELLKARKKRVPVFAYASEDRFKDLFTALREDAQLNTTYLILMILSTFLATVGLYLNSASVIIGAMVLAPLMAPIISMAMSLLRSDRSMFWSCFTKIGVGIAIALSTAAFMTLVSPYQPFTTEMQGRLNPTVLDLLVAVAAGIAGAYTKSFKEILQSLAGVAIAVALVPPLAVAGIGLGRLDLVFFSQAFLLFSTNLIGIVIAATFTFWILGYSPVVRDKKGLSVIIFTLCIILAPLTLSYNRIVEQARFEKAWKQERFLVNDKYLIVSDAKLNKFQDESVLTIELQAREQLTRRDLTEFKRKVNTYLYNDIAIRARVTYIP